MQAIFIGSERFEKFNRTGVVALIVSLEFPVIVHFVFSGNEVRYVCLDK